ncbi:MAG TPA: IPT/TIG domain-containing protein [Candidatus Hydrogenedentes bacterium]|nr:IPT/TIG domain-containing protein [Candidatus Hydrogenedentota bacterium]
MLPLGFIYFGSSVPTLDVLPWRESNFIERTVGGTRTILGAGFEDPVNLIADPLGVDSTFATVTPVAQREINFNYPADTNGLGLAAGERLVSIDVENVAGGETFSTTLVYTEERTVLNPPADGAVYFDINSINVTTVGATDIVRMDIENYRTQFEIFFGDVLVPSGTITLITAPNPPGNYNGVIEFPVPAQNEGVWGPVDVRVESPTGTTENRTTEVLYTIAENGYSYRRAGIAPQGDSVVPDMVPDNGSGPVRITGQNFTGATNATGGGVNTAGVYTRVWLDDPANAGLEIDLSTQASVYSIDSFSQIGFEIDLDAVDPTATLIPRDTPIDLVFEQFDGVNGTVLANTTSRFTGAITFLTAAPPVILTIVPDRGPVGGIEQDPAAQITITGTDFGATAPIVLFGSSQANIVSYTAQTTIVVDLPPAPGGLPGVYDVTVIRTSDLVTDSVIDGFTYEIAGAPVVTAVSPNHIFFDPADPTTSEDPAFLTIIGYNFDDDVRITFSDDIAAATDELRLDTLSNPDQVRVLSPNEITVQLTRANMVTLLQAIDYTGAVADMSITVQNQAATIDPIAEPALAATVTSDPPTPFFAFNDARGSVEVDIPELLYNDVYFNNQDDYVNVAPGPGSISIDPGLANTPWIGKLIPDSASAPLLNTAGPFEADPFSFSDFELESRAQGDGPEIGADEIIELFELQICSWYVAEVSPNPVGFTAPNQLIVRVQYTGDCGGVPFITPQGGDPFDPNDRIPLELYLTLGNNTYLYTNTDIIQTVLDPAGSDTPSTANLVADGHAVIHMQRGSDIVGMDGNDFASSTPSSSLTDGGLIIGQAIQGRHFLIDTVPPRMFIEFYGALDEPVQGIDSATFFPELIVTSNDVITAQDINLGTHPQGAPPAPPATLLDGTVYPPSNLALPVVPDSLGGIYFRGVVPNTISEGAQVFFNRGSESNPDSSDGLTVSTGARLNTTVRVVFIDPPVTDPDDPTQTPLVSDDWWTLAPETRRQVAGFPVLGSIETIDEAAGALPEDNILLSGIVRWEPDTTLSLTTGFQKQARYIPTAGPGLNVGVFDPSLAGDDVTVPSPTSGNIVDNDVITAEWDLVDLVPLVGQTWRVRARFIGEDLAFNFTTNDDPVIYKTLFDPLQMWWMYDVNSELTGPTDCQVTNLPYFNVGLIGQRPSPTGGPFPAYTYNLWTSPTWEGVYTDAGIFGGWAPYRSVNVINLLAELDATQLASLENQYVLIVAHGADEAGNVEDNDPLTGPTIDLTDPSIQLPRNWKKFFFSNQPAPETNLGLEIWYDLNNNGVLDGGEPIFGDSPIIPLPPDPLTPIRARFALSAGIPANLTASDTAVSIRWTFQEDGNLTSQSDGSVTFPHVGPLTSNSDTRAIFAPPAPLDAAIVPTLFPGRLGDVNRRRAVTYLFTASAFYIKNGNDGPTNTANDVLIQDPTPAVGYFVVVPAGVGDFVMSPEDQEKQPFKEQGIE